MKRIENTPMSLYANDPVYQWWIYVNKAKQLTKKRQTSDIASHFCLHNLPEVTSRLSVNGAKQTGAGSLHSGNIENALEEFVHNYFDYLTRLQLIRVDLL